MINSTGPGRQTRSRVPARLPLRLKAALLSLASLSLVWTASPPAASEDAGQGRYATVELADGGSLTGYVTEEGDIVIVRKGAGVLRFPKDKVTAIKYQVPPKDAAAGAGGGELAARIDQLEKRIQALEKFVQNLQAAGVPAAATTPAAPAAPPAPVAVGTPVAPAPAAPVAPPPAALPAGFAPELTAEADKKTLSEFVPWMKKQVKMKSASNKDVCKYLEAQLNRWSVLPREISMRAAEFSAMQNDPTRRVVVLEATVLATNKNGGYIFDIWMEDGNSTRFPLPDAVYRAYWNRMFRYSYSEVDRYFVEPLFGNTLRKFISTGNAMSADDPQVQETNLKQSQELKGGVGFFLPDGLKNLVLCISANLVVEETVIGAPSGAGPGVGGVRPPRTGGTNVKLKHTQETVRLKVGDMPAPAVQ